MKVTPMGNITAWFSRLGNSGAIANAAAACRDRLEAAAAVESNLRRITLEPQRRSMAAS